MIFDLPEEVLKLFKTFEQNNHKLYLVGGAVRDLLLGKSLKDWDFTTDATPEEILQIFPDGFSNNQFGTVGIASESTKSIFEITTMRKEGEYTDFRHPGEIVWTDKIEEDLNRRDFTINAIALDLSLGNNYQIIDPFAGQQDLKSKTIRAVGEADKRFNEDALRLMRAVRLATQLGFLIEEKTFASIKKNAALIKQISWERIRDELFKMLGSDYPYDGVVLLRNAGLLEYILPEIEKCFGIVQQGPKHDRVYDIGEHSLLSLKFCPSKDPLVRFASLVHDIGKVDTVSVEADGNVTFYNHDLVGAKIVKQLGEKLKLSKKEIEKLVNLVRWHMFTVNEHQTDSAIRRFIKNIGKENIEDMMDLRIADRLGGGTEKQISWRMEEFRKRIDEVMTKPFSISDLKINGTDVMEILNLKPSKRVGEVLQELFKEVLEDHTKNNKEYLISKVKQL